MEDKLYFEEYQILQIIPAQGVVALFEMTDEPPSEETVICWALISWYEKTDKFTYQKVVGMMAESNDPDGGLTIVSNLDNFIGYKVNVREKV
jgi:hypothetical protein